MESDIERTLDSLQARIFWIIFKEKGIYYTLAGGFVEFKLFKSINPDVTIHCTRSHCFASQSWFQRAELPSFLFGNFKFYVLSLVFLTYQLRGWDMLKERPLTWIIVFIKSWLLALDQNNPIPLCYNHSTMFIITFTSALHSTDIQSQFTTNKS